MTGPVGTLVMVGGRVEACDEVAQGRLAAAGLADADEDGVAAGLLGEHAGAYARWREEGDGWFQREAASGGLVTCTREGAGVRWHLVDCSLARAGADAERLDALGDLAADMAHDYNSTLQVLLGLSEMMLLTAPDDAALRAELGTLHETTRRAAERTEQLFRAAAPPVLLPCELGAMVSEAARGVDVPEGVTVSCEVQEVVVTCDPAQIRRVLVELVRNAAEAMPGGGEVVVRVGPGQRGGAPVLGPRLDGRCAGMEVSDTGTGMDGATVRRMFAPFFTTRERGRGRGLGLWVVYRTVRAHGGCVWVDSAPGRGTTISLALPG